MKQETLDYIIRFLVQDEAFTQYDVISYGRKQEKRGLLIWQSDFFDEAVYGKKTSLPVLPLQKIEGTYVLFGEAHVEENEMGIVLYADVIASAYFLLSRYEEWVCRDLRDEHGRFPGKKSLPYRAGFLDRPIIEEYGKLLRNYLRKLGLSVSEPEETFASITLTHDIDRPWTEYSFAGAIRRMLGSLYHQKKFVLYPMMNFFHQYSKDPYCIFEEMIEMDRQVENAEIVFFIIAGVTEKIEASFDYLSTKAFRKIWKKLEERDCQLGLHISYEGGGDPDLILKEQEKLEKVTGKRATAGRHHYLRSREPEDMRKLTEAGITDDYTMSYADVAGFRLGTSRKVRWIDPLKKELTPLILHPLQIMDCSLNGSDYMNMEYPEALEYSKRIIENTRRSNGDLCLLWHNTTLARDYPYYTRELYGELLKELQ